MEIILDMDKVRDGVIERAVAQLFRNRWDDDDEGSAPVNIERLVTDAVNRRLESIVQVAAEAIIDARVGVAVDKVLDDGWASVDEYGRQGKRYTVATLVAEKLAGRSRYDGLSRVIDDKISKFANTELVAAQKAGLERFKKSIDEAVGAKFSEVMREALRSI